MKFESLKEVKFNTLEKSEMKSVKGGGVKNISSCSTCDGGDTTYEYDIDGEGRTEHVMETFDNDWWE